MLFSRFYLGLELFQCWRNKTSSIIKIYFNEIKAQGAMTDIGICNYYYYWLSQLSDWVNGRVDAIKALFPSKYFRTIAPTGAKIELNKTTPLNFYFSVAICWSFRISSFSTSDVKRTNWVKSPKMTERIADRKSAQAENEKNIFVFAFQPISCESRNSRSLCQLVSRRRRARTEKY